MGHPGVPTTSTAVALQGLGAVGQREQKTHVARDSPGESPPHRYLIPPECLITLSCSCRRLSWVTTGKDGSNHHVPDLNLLLSFSSTRGISEEPAWLDKAPGLCAWEK